MVGHNVGENIHLSRLINKKKMIERLKVIGRICFTLIYISIFFYFVGYTIVNRIFLEKLLKNLAEFSIILLCLSGMLFLIQLVIFFVYFSKYKKIKKLTKKNMFTKLKEALFAFIKILIRKIPQRLTDSIKSFISYFRITNKICESFDPLIKKLASLTYCRKQYLKFLVKVSKKNDTQTFWLFFYYFFCQK